VPSTTPAEPAPADPQAKAAPDHGMLYQQAVAMEQDGKAAESVRIYRRAARAGSGKAAKRLGEIYDKGIPGVSRDYAESLQWYETARQLGENIETAGSRGGPEAPVVKAPVRAPAPAMREPSKAAPVPVAKAAPVPEPAKAAEPAPVPAPAATPAPSKAAAPAPAAPKAAEPSAPETKPGWFSVRGLLIALLVLGLIAWRRARRREKARARQSQAASGSSQRHSIAATDGSPAEAAVLIAALSEIAKLDRTAIDACLRIVRECTEAAKGRVIRTKGDETVASFPSADAAADAAVQMQDAIDELKPVGGSKIGIRIGVSHGPISIEADGNIYGEGVNVASRLSQIAVKGQIVTTRDTVKQMSPMLKSATRKITAIQIKGKAAEVEVYELMWRQSEDATTMAAARSAYKPRKTTPQTDAALFVSYSHKDRPRVEPIVSVIEEMGRKVWIDRSDITGQTGWAGQIVRAIRECRAVVLMASPNSYSSDQVVRELYLAMNHRKTIVPIEIEPAEMPDELQYILAPFQHHRLSGGEARAVLGRALAAV
jgi:class 3 adenylate cyclase